jgi:hypothetical protein
VCVFIANLQAIGVKISKSMKLSASQKQEWAQYFSTVGQLPAVANELKFEWRLQQFLETKSRIVTTDAMEVDERSPEPLLSEAEILTHSGNPKRKKRTTVPPKKVLVDSNARHLDIELGAYVVYKTNATERFKDIELGYHLSVSIGRIMSLEPWPPTNGSVADVQWLYSEDQDETPWQNVQFYHWEYERETDGRREIHAHSGSVKLEELAQLHGKVLTVELSRKKEVFKLTPQSCTALESWIAIDENDFWI